MARFIFVLCCCVGRSEVLVCSKGSRTSGSYDHTRLQQEKWQGSRSRDSNHNGSRSEIDAPTAKNVSCTQMLTSMFVCASAPSHISHCPPYLLSPNIGLIASRVEVVVEESIAILNNVSLTSFFSLREGIP
jgi:hypothetical protein